MQIHVVRDVSDLATVDSDLVSEHARRGDLDRVCPVIVVVAQGVGEVQDGVLRNLGGVRRNVEVSGLDSSLSHRVRHQEEVEDAVHYF